MNNHERRFWSKVKKANSCWLWRGFITPNGYGVFTVRDEHWLAHRYAYQLRKPLPPDLCVCHRCDNKRCVRPSHLFTGSHMENNHDRDHKGRGISRRKLDMNAEKVKMIRALHHAGFGSPSVARAFGMNKAAVWRIMHRQRCAEVE